LIYREILRTKSEMKGHDGFFNLKKLDADSKKASEMQQD
jgi:hypothetical protein